MNVKVYYYVFAINNLILLNTVIVIYLNFVSDFLKCLANYYIQKYEAVRRYMVI